MAAPTPTTTTVDEYLRSVNHTVSPEERRLLLAIRAAGGQVCPPEKLEIFKEARRRYNVAEARAWLPGSLLGISLAFSGIVTRAVWNIPHAGPSGIWYTDCSLAIAFLSLFALFGKWLCRVRVWVKCAEGTIDDSLPVEMKGVVNRVEAILAITDAHFEMWTQVRPESQETSPKWSEMEDSSFVCVRLGRRSRSASITFLTLRVNPIEPW